MGATEPARLSAMTDFIQKRTPRERVIALAGNPNVGKSTVFNGLTGLKQHTGNWPGKTVGSARGACASEAFDYMLIDIPGTYSLMAHSAEEEVARDFICFGNPDAVVVVCDATCLKRNLNLVLQIMEVSRRVLVCVNLMDEAYKKRIDIDLKALEHRLGVPVVGVVARKKRALKALPKALDKLLAADAQTPRIIDYGDDIERALAEITPVVADKCARDINSRWLSVKLLEGDAAILNELRARVPALAMRDNDIETALARARQALAERGVDGEKLRDRLVSALMSEAEALSRGVVSEGACGYGALDRRLDKLFTSRLTGYPIMLIMLCLIFWLTISGANVPSAYLSKLLFGFQNTLSRLFNALGAPGWLHDALVLGVYRVLAWVVSVMLPPMAIFFPLFTMLEDAGYLPRVAYNLDKPFKKCSACGKQALCMCMGFGCNAAGVTGCRIIDSPRERLIAILTNSLVPCNGRFPMLIAIITMFFAFGLGSFGAAFMVSLIIVVGVGATLFASKLLSKTLLKGMPSSFTLEMPPYRAPEWGRLIVRSLLDRTLFVLGRAVLVAAPAGLIIWLMANVRAGDASLLAHATRAFDPFARLLGMDGVILMAFILAFPANEIVIPIAIMAYLSQGSLIEMESLSDMKALFIQNGWTPVTALCTVLFSLMHWPCSTTLITIYKETKSAKWTLAAFILPTFMGMLVCFIIATVGNAFFT